MRFSQSGLNRKNSEMDINSRIEQVNVNFGHHLSISVTKRCPLRCTHCIVSSLPSNDLSLDLPNSVVKKINDSFSFLSPKLKQISFTGGEPFLRTDIIDSISSAARKFDIACGAVTSASWASSEKKAIKVLSELRYLSHITISSDIYHEKYLDRKNVRNAVRAAEKLKMSKSIRVCVPPILTECHNQQLTELKSEFGDLVHTQQVVDFGRGAELQVVNVMVSKIPSLPCLSSGPHITANGNMLPCCSTLSDEIDLQHPLNLGSALKNSVVELVHGSHRNTLLTFIRLWGFGDVMKRLQEEFPNKFSKVVYADEAQCTLCATIMHDDEVVKFLSSWMDEIEQVTNVAVGSWIHFDNKELLSSLKERKHEINLHRSISV
jgi:pyruvate-formate lyase-activating enzyme